MFINIARTLLKKHIMPVAVLGFILVIISIFAIFSSLGSPSQAPIPGSVVPTTILDTIPTPGNSTPEEQLEIQTRADRNFSQEYEKITKNYPWFEKLPILTGDYFIYFDLEKKQFVARIYSTNSVVIENIKLKIIDGLKKTIGPDSSKYPVRWDIPQSTPAP